MSASVSFIRFVQRTHFKFELIRLTDPIYVVDVTFTETDVASFLQQQHRLYFDELAN